MAARTLDCLAIETRQSREQRRYVERRRTRAGAISWTRKEFAARENCECSSGIDGFVRLSGLAPGSHSDNARFVDPSHAHSWPPLLFLVDLYNQALLTMGDEEFFSSSGGPSSSSTNIESRNPLTIDELTSFSRQLLNIVFVLYWREDLTNVQDSCVPGVANLKWETAREKMTKLLQAIHAREWVLPSSPFVSED